MHCCADTGEEEALLRIKSALTDPKGWLAAWVPGFDYCNWQNSTSSTARNITCNANQRVTML
jgi:Leucine rich repeat N-terminal domain